MKGGLAAELRNYRTVVCPRLPISATRCHCIRCKSVRAILLMLSLGERIDDHSLILGSSSPYFPPRVGSFNTCWSCHALVPASTDQALFLWHWSVAANAPFIGDPRFT